MNASTNPPTTAPVSEPSPPITVAMNALSTGLKPIVGSTVPRRARMKIAATPASAPEIANATAITRLAEIPMSRVTWKSWLAASMPRPCIERRRKSVSTTSDAKQVIVVITCSQPIEYVPPKWKALVEDVRQRHALLPRRDERQEEVLDDHAEREAREQQRDEARAAQRPERDALHQHGRDRRRDDRRDHLDRERHAVLVLEVDRVRRDRHELAVREVDEAEDREHHRQAEGEQRVGRAEAERVDELLQWPPAQRSPSTSAHSDTPMPRYARSISAEARSSAAALLVDASPIAST